MGRTVLTFVFLLVASSACQPAQVVGHQALPHVAIEEHDSLLGDTPMGVLGSRLLAVGDVNGDGLDDLVASAPGRPDTEVAGAVYLFVGQDGGLSPTPLWSVAGSSGDRLGQGLAAGDFDGDGLVDLVISAPHAEADAGIVSMFRGAPNGFEDQPAWQVTGEAGDFLGLSLASAGDVDVDGVAEVLVSAARCSSDPSRGAALLLTGADGSPWSGETAGGPWEACLTSLDDPWPAVAGPGDVDGDGYDDIAVGDPERLSDGDSVGAVLVWHGGPGGPPIAPSTVILGDVDNGDLDLGATLVGPGDVNGDGFADILAASPRAEPDGPQTGAARLFRGSAGGLQPWQWSVGGDAEYGRYGEGLGAVGDLDGDGFADFAIGAPRDSGPEGDIEQRGAVYIYLGSEYGPSYLDVWVAAGADTYEHFGSAITGADVDGDGFPELIVAAIEAEAPGFDDGPEGRIDLFDVRADAPSRDPWPLGQGTSESGYGAAAVALGDVDGDGYDDVAIGAPGGSAVEVYFGSAEGPSPTPRSLAGSATDDRFGEVIAGAGDLDCDGRTDIAVGAPAANASAGAVHIFLGAAEPGWQSPDHILTGPAAGDRLGAALAVAGDVHGDGCHDLLVGAPGTSAGAGAAFLYAGGPDGPSSEPAWSLIGDEPGAQLGAAVAGVGDVDGDGHSDLLVGEPYADVQLPDLGRVLLFLGDPAGPSSAPAWSQAGPEPDLAWGSVFAPAGDVNGDGRADFLVGLPLFSWHEYAASGQLFLFMGGAAEPIEHDWPLLGYGDQARVGASVGTAGDVDGDGYADFVVGEPGYRYEDIETGRVRLYRGGPLGPEPPDSLVWETVGPAGDGDRGVVTGAAGDVDGDGFSDLLVVTAAPAGGEARVGIWPGGHDVLTVPAFGPRPRVLHPGTDDPIAPGGLSRLAEGFDLRIDNSSAWGHTRGRLEVEVKRWDRPFDGVDLQAGGWADVAPASAPLLAEVRGLDEDTAWHWRARLGYSPAGAGVGRHSRWLYGGDGSEPGGVHLRTPCAEDRNGNGVCDFGEDVDGDGWAGAEDCDDDDPAIHPAAAEVCGSGVDEDCDELTDLDDPVCWWGCDCSASSDGPGAAFALVLLLGALVRTRVTTGARPPITRCR